MEIVPIRITQQIKIFPPVCSCSKIGHLITRENLLFWTIKHTFLLFQNYIMDQISYRNQYYRPWNSNPRDFNVLGGSRINGQALYKNLQDYPPQSTPLSHFQPKWSGQPGFDFCARKLTILSDRCTAEGGGEVNWSRQELAAASLPGLAERRRIRREESINLTNSLWWKWGFRESPPLSGRYSLL